MTEAPFMMEQTTAYIALENFKIKGFTTPLSDEYGVFGVIR
jgi:putative hemolysin